MIPPCNCDTDPIQGYDGCPLEDQGKQCKKKGVIYCTKITATDNNNNQQQQQQTEFYTGLTGDAIKSRISGHTTTFKYERYEKSTTLSGHIWKLKNENKSIDLKWSLLDRGPIYNPITKKCRLCCLEKFYILFKKETASLNKRSEIFTSCRHKRKKLLSNTPGWGLENFTFILISLVIL